MFTAELTPPANDKQHAVIHERINSSTPSAAYMRRWTGSALFQVTACRLLSGMPFTGTNVDLSSIGPLGTNFSEIVIAIQTFSLNKMHLKMSSAIFPQIFQGRRVKLCCMCTWTLGDYHMSYVSIFLSLFRVSTRQCNRGPTLKLTQLVRMKQDGLLFAEKMFEIILCNGHCCILIQISLKYIPISPMGNKSAMVQLMAWRRTRASIH